MKIKNFAIIGIIIIILTGASAIIVTDYKVPKEVETLEWDVTVVQGRNIGFNADTDALHFGNLCQTCSSRRHFRVHNQYPFPIRVEIHSAVPEGLEKTIHISPNNKFIINQNKTQIFDADFIMSKPIENGNYSGYILINIYKKLPWEEEQDFYPRLPGVFDRNIVDAWKAGREIKERIKTNQ